MAGFSVCEEVQPRKCRNGTDWGQFRLGVTQIPSHSHLSGIQSAYYLRVQCSNKPNGNIYLAGNDSGREKGEWQFSPLPMKGKKSLARWFGSSWVRGRPESGEGQDEQKQG